MKASLQLKNSIYQVVISYKDIDGKNKTKWVSTGLKKDTGKRKLEETKKAILEDFEKEFNQRLYASPTSRYGFTPIEKYKFLDFLDIWLETIKPSVAYNTIKGYTKNVRRIKAFFQNYNLMLDEVKPIHIQKFYNSLYAEGLSGNSVLHLHACLHRAFEYAMKTELVFSNPTDRTERPKCEKYVASFYNKEEIAQLFELFKGDRMELCVHIAAYYGLRRSEVVGLKWDAVDFEQKTLTIKHKVIDDYIDGKEVIIAEDKLKNASSRRTLPLIPHIEKLLLEEKQKQEYYMDLLKDGYNTEYKDYICRDNFGNLITPAFISDHFRFMIRKHGMKKIRFHDLRHSCASLLLANGIQMKQIQDWLGHSTYNVTANFYSHLDYCSKLESAAAMSQILG